MARPTTFDRQTSFTQFSSQFPAKPQNGASLDAEFNAVKVAVDETQSNLALIQDADGKLARGSVGRAQFDSSITLGFESPTAWAPDTSYTAETSTVFYQAKFYQALESHVSGDTFELSKWTEIADLSASVAIEDGSVTEAKLASSAATAEKIGSLAVTTPKIASQAVTNSKIADEAVTLTKIADALPAQLRDLILPAGLGPCPWPFSGDPPAGWIADNATYARADYPALWLLIEAELALPNGSTYFTAGDGSITFGIKNLAGLAVVGLDASSVNLNGMTRVGLITGAKEVTLTQAQLPAFKPGITITDPGHQHVDTGSGSIAAEAASASGIDVLRTVGTHLTDSAATGITAAFTNNLGSGQAHSNVQPSIATRYIFKAH